DAAHSPFVPSEAEALGSRLRSNGCLDFARHERIWGKMSVADFRTLDDLGDVAGKRVLVREDLNAPMADGKVTDDTRLRAAVPTVAELADKGAIVLVLAHIGRPKAPA